MKSILFYWSKGSTTRVKILQSVDDCDKNGQSCFASKIAERLGISHVAVRKHKNILVQNGYLRILNSHGRPEYLTLTEKGKSVLEEFKENQAIPA